MSTAESKERLLLGAISYTDPESYATFLKEMMPSHALAVLVHASREAKSRGIFTVDEESLIDVAVQAVSFDPVKHNNLANFDWSRTKDDALKQILAKEMMNRVYEAFYEVKDGDIVLDLGASVGCFIHTILDRNFSKCYAVEPISYFHDSIQKNSNGRATIIHAALSDQKAVKIDWDGQTEEVMGIGFLELIKLNKIDRIDFLKTDCEGGEYSVFTEQNLDWIKENCRYCVGEWHLSTPDLKNKFREFRDRILPRFKHFEILSVSGSQITHLLHEPKFIDYFSEIIIHIEI